MWEEVPAGLAYFVVYAKNRDNLVTSSKILAVDFSNRLDPETIIIEDDALSGGVWFPPRVKVNGKQMNFDVPPVIQSGRTLVPLRAIFEELGATVEWEEATRTIIANKGNTWLTLRIGDRNAEINGNSTSIDVPPQITNGRTLVPLRFISESLGAEVSWNQQLQLAVIR